MPKGITIEPFFTGAISGPYSGIKFESRTIAIEKETGEVLFEQTGVKVPEFWSENAGRIACSKYFYGKIGTREREKSVQQMIDRVVNKLAEWGSASGYLDKANKKIFIDELTYVLVHQIVAFNSPVWFNVGTPKPVQQVSACYILNIEDNMKAILDAGVEEGMIFKGGSGAGTNLSKIRGSMEHLSSGGIASGPVSFMKPLDSWAGVIKSAGATRRAALMRILNIDHPDIKDFIWCKAREEKKIAALLAAGYTTEFEGKNSAMENVFFQNANNSVRVTDAFMRKATGKAPDDEWALVGRGNGETIETVSATELLSDIAEAAWQCADPGMQFDTTINDWHTCPESGDIEASNPCVTGDTLISTTEGLVPIQDLVGKETVGIITADGTISPVTKIFKTGHKQVYLLKTSSGYTLKVTEDHPIWTVNRGDVPAKDLKEDDQLQLVPGKFGQVGIGTKMAEYLGLLLGDGCKSGPQDQLCLTMGDTETGIMQEVVDFLNNVKDSRKIKGFTKTDTGIRVTTSDRGVVWMADKYTVLDQGASKKRLTPAAFTLYRDSVAAILRGLFTADGTVGYTPDKNAYISLDLTSLTLLRQVQQMLLQFGIKSKIYENRRGGATTSVLPDGKGGTKEYNVQEMHSLRISRNSRVLFEKHIGFWKGSTKAQCLYDLNTNVGTYTDKLTDTFASLEQLGTEDVFDLTEPKTSHFIAGGLLVHNCSEYMFINDTSCNLASIRLTRCIEATQDDKLRFNHDKFIHVCKLMAVAMDILVEGGDYPTAKIAENTKATRTLGLGYADLGALLMQLGFPYDSLEGRQWCSAITSLMTAVVYSTSIDVAAEMGPFKEFEKNKAAFKRVMTKHRQASQAITSTTSWEVVDAANEWWDDVVNRCEGGVRNAQATVLAPTGTIAFILDCDTTGIEPDLALVKKKRLVGGGDIKIINSSVEPALRNLEAYTEEEVRQICDHVLSHGSVDEAPHLLEEHKAVFDCAVQTEEGGRTISAMGHLGMMAAAQPFLSGAISKTINLPSTATAEEMKALYITAWESKLKAVAIYRYGCKNIQPLSTLSSTVKPSRRKMPSTRKAMIHSFSIGGHEGYLKLGFHEDGSIGEFFLQMAKTGSTVSGLVDAWAISCSLAMQYGVPMSKLAEKFQNTKFEPYGITNNADIRFATSIVDYVFKFIEGLSDEEDTTTDPKDNKSMSSTGEICARCGNLMQRTGTCYTCTTCFESSGCG
jgi:ribonucleoside-diphosphate reductase alpha chain